MQVAYRVAESPGKGRGLFAVAAVPRFSLVWDFNAANVRLFSDDGARALVLQLQGAGGLPELLSYAYFTADAMLVDLREDDGRFFNHSPCPNVALGGLLAQWGVPGEFHALSTYALRDIAPGEELLDDYTTYGRIVTGVHVLVWLVAFSRAYPLITTNHPNMQGPSRNGTRRFSQATAWTFRSCTQAAMKARRPGCSARADKLWRVRRPSWRCRRRFAYLIETLF